MVRGKGEWGLAEKEVERGEMETSVIVSTVKIEKCELYRHLIKMNEALPF